MIKTISYDQCEIIKNIIELFCQNGIKLDLTYSIGNFYKKGLSHVFIINEVERAGFYTKNLFYLQKQEL